MLLNLFCLFFCSCPSCSMFTSLLAENYRELQPGKQVQVIYISSDTDEQSFHQSFQTMPWLALDYRDWQKRGDLMKMFRVDGLPKVVLLDGDTGRLISMNGTEQVYQLDYQKKYYSWASYQ